MKLIAMKFWEKQAELFTKRGINWYVNSVVVRQEESLEVTCYVYLLNCCKEYWFSMLSVLENFFVTMKLQNLGIKKPFLRGCSRLLSQQYAGIIPTRARTSQGNRTREVRSL